VGDVDDDGYADLVITALLNVDGRRPEEYAMLLYRGGPDGVEPLPSDTTGRDPSGRWGDSLDASSVLVIDSNGDGVKELVLTQPGLRLTAVLELRGGLDPADITVLDMEARVPGAFTGAGGVSAGDFNGDGLGDLVFSVFTPEQSDTGVVYLLPGQIGEPLSVERAEPVLEAPASEIGSVEITGHEVSYQFGISLSAVGDVDGDGFDDLIVGTDDRAARAPLLFFGSPAGFRTDTFVRVGEHPSPWRNDMGMYAHGDVDGDGLEDFALIPGYGSTPTGAPSTLVELYRSGVDLAHPAQSWDFAPFPVMQAYVVLGY
jgi:hypothetical protein